MSYLSDMIDALFVTIDKGDIISFYPGNNTSPWVKYKVIDKLPSHIMLENKQSGPILMKWEDFIKLNELEESQRPHFKKYYKTDEYKRRIKAFCER